MLFVVTALVLVCAVVLGGGTRTGFMGDVIVQAISVPLLILAVVAAFRPAEQIGGTSTRGHTADAPSHVVGRYGSARIYAVLLFIALVVLAVVQLAPLPANVIAKVAPHGALGGLAGLPGLDVGATWRTVSITPHATWSGLVSLIVPLAVFLAIAQLSDVGRTRIVWLLMMLGAISLSLGLLQVAQGPESNLRLYAITNPSEAVGFFANRNHFAAQMYVLLVVTTAWIAGRLVGETNSAGGGLLASPVNLLWYALGFGLLVAIMASLATARSRAGVLLTMAAIVGLIALVRSERERLPVVAGAGVRGTLIGRFLPLTLGFAVLFAMQFGLHRMMSRFELDPLEDLRVPLAKMTLEAAWKSLPLGTGIGSFVPVYGVVERPTELSGEFANRAHNDFAEWFLEAGWISAALMVVAVVWFLKAAWRVWRRGEGSSEHRLLQRAATLILPLLFAHSFVDYPLRTTSMMAVAALAAGLLVPPMIVVRRDDDIRDGGRDRASSGKSTTTSTPPPKPAPVRPITPFAAAEDATAWPEAWRSKPENQKRSADDSGA